MSQKTLSLLLFVAAVFALPQFGNAELIINPGTVVGTNITSHNPGTAYTIDHAIDQSGLSAGYTSGVTDFDSFFASGGPTHAISGLDTHFLGISNGGYVDFDLGQVYNLNSIAVWNWHNSQGNVGVTDIEVFRSADLSFTSLTSIGDFDFSINSSTTAQLRQFATPANARYLRLNISNALFPTRPGFGELAFGVVPEPSSFLMFSVGLVGLVYRRRT